MTTDTNGIPRVPAGVRAGGQFMVHPRTEPATSLTTPAVEAALADYGDLDAADRLVDEADRQWRRAREAHRRGDASDNDLRAAEESLVIAIGGYPWPVDEPVVHAYAGCRPVRVGPSGRYAFYRPKPSYDEYPNRRPNPGDTAHGPVVQVAYAVDGTWYPTPARYFTDTLLEDEPARLAIDYGQNWVMDTADTAALLQYARDVATAGYAS